MSEGYLPPELARRWGNLPYIQEVNRTEWSAACPQCGDCGHDWQNGEPDRFRMWINPAFGWCRKCNYKAFADDDKKDFVITPEQRQAWIDERRKREEENKRRAEAALAMLQREQEWLNWHSTMPERGKAWWRAKGVPDYLQTTYSLGWCVNRRIGTKNGILTTDTATIPVPDVNGEVVNVRHRLINPTNPNDKYRPDRPGLPASPFIAAMRKPRNEAILLEGEIKAVIVFDQLGGKIDVIGSAGKSSMPDIELFADCERVIIALDPDAKTNAWGMAKALGGRGRVVYLPAKPDDLFTVHGASRADFLAAIEYGRAL